MEEGAGWKLQCITQLHKHGVIRSQVNWGIVYIKLHVPIFKRTFQRVLTNKHTHHNQDIKRFSYSKSSLSPSPSLWLSSWFSLTVPLLSCSSYGKLSLHQHAINNQTWARSSAFSGSTLLPPSCTAPAFCGPSDMVVGNKCSASFIY